MSTGYSDVESLSQITTFFLACAFGVAAATVYAVFSAVRRTFLKGRTAVFVADVLFFVLAAFGFYLFLLVRCRGEVRDYAALGCAGGFFAFELTAGRAVSSGLSYFFKELRCAVRLVMRRAVCPALFFWRRAARTAKRKIRGVFINRKKPADKAKRANSGRHKKKSTADRPERAKTAPRNNRSYSRGKRHKNIQNSPTR